MSRIVESRLVIVAVPVIMLVFVVMTVIVTVFRSVAVCVSFMPMLMIMSIVAGRLKVHRALFLATGITGRFARFLVTAGMFDWIQTYLPT